MIRRKRRQEGESGVVWRSGERQVASRGKARCDASRDAQDTWDAEYPALASGHNAGGSDARSIFADALGAVLAQKKKKTVETPRIKGADAGELEPESSGMQASVTWANLGTPVLRSRGQGERETDLGKASRTPADNSGKCNLPVMLEVNDPYGSDGSPEPQRKVASEVGTIDDGIGVEPDRGDGEHNLTRQLADRPSPINIRSPLTSNLLGCSCGIRYSDSPDLNNYYIGEEDPSKVG